MSKGEENLVLEAREDSFIFPYFLFVAKPYHISYAIFEVSFLIPPF
jgi:hypothetical protein